MRSTSSFSAVSRMIGTFERWARRSLQHIEPGSVRQHDVEHDEIDLVRRQPLVQLVAACRKQHAEALALDIAGEKLADLRIVVGDENALLRGHQMLYRRRVAATRPFL